jgi:fumarylacetoacetate (FAA) hydrolase family protein
MNKGVEILLARMNSNPEEFIEKLDDFVFPNSERTNEDRATRVRQKWDGVIQKLLDKDKDGNSLLEEFLTKEEVKALYDKYLELIRNKFTQSVMKRLFEGEKPTRAEAFPKKKR